MSEWITLVFAIWYAAMRIVAAIIISTWVQSVALQYAKPWWQGSFGSTCLFWGTFLILMDANSEYKKISKS